MKALQGLGLNLLIILISILNVLYLQILRNVFKKSLLEFDDVNDGVDPRNLIH